MAVVYKVSTREPAEDRLAMRRAVSHLQTACGSAGTYRMDEGTESMRWTFFNLAMDDALEAAVAEKFADMISKYRGKDHEKFDSFVADYMSSKGCSAKIGRAG